MPLGAHTLAHAVCSTLAGLPESSEGWERMTPVLTAAIAPVLGEILADANLLLRDRGVRIPSDGEVPQAGWPEPAPAPESSVSDRTEAVSERLSPDEGPADGLARQSHPSVSGEGTPDRLTEPAAASMDAARSLDRSPLARPVAPSVVRVVPALQPVATLESDAVAFAHAIGVVPYSRESRHAYFRNVHERLARGGAAAGQLAVVDVVAAMFDYVIDDRRLPESAKPLVWRLYQPSIALALLDPGYLGQDGRSVRSLVENFGAIATAFSDELVKGGELHRRLETVVRAVEIVAGALQTRSVVMARQVEHEYDRASRNVAQLIERVANERKALEATPGRRNRRDFRRRPGREREREVGERLRSELDKRFENRHVPESVRDFVFNVWLRQLRTAALRDGEDSGEFKVAMQVVDDLLWSLDSGQGRISRRQLAERIPPLIRLLTSGVREVGAKDEEYKSFFDELFLVHLRRMQGRASTADASTTRAGRHAGAGGPPTDPLDSVPVLEQRVALDTSGARPAVHDDAAVSGGDDAALGTAAHQADQPPRPAAGEALAGGVPGKTAITTAQRVVGSSAVAADPGPSIGSSRGRDEPPSEPEEGPGAPGPEQRLLEVLSSLDLADAPLAPRRRELLPDDALHALKRGDWIDIVGAEGRAAIAKVAWINSRRTVVLLVRHPDRKALSLRMSELGARFHAGRAGLLVR
jgi:hypothetical protein